MVVDVVGDLRREGAQRVVRQRGQVHHGVDATQLLDGDVAQDGTTADMVHDIPKLISYASQAFTLLPGDVILTGTPAGVGEIRAGQRVEVEVEGIGSFSNPVVRR